MRRRISQEALDEVRGALDDYDYEADNICTGLTSSGTKDDYKKRSRWFVQWLAGEKTICGRHPCDGCLTQ